MTYPHARAAGVFRKRVAISVLSVSVATIALAQQAHHHADHSVAGEPGNAAKVDRTVKIEMIDSMRFAPNRIAVKKGETVRFVVTNTGRVDHEFVLGSAEMLRQHAAAMKKHPDMHHEGAHHLTVPPGDTRETVWRFTQPGTIEFACLVPGHFEAGMRGKVTVK